MKKSIFMTLVRKNPILNMRVAVQFVIIVVVFHYLAHSQKGDKNRNIDNEYKFCFINSLLYESFKNMISYIFHATFQLFTRYQRSKNDDIFVINLARS